MKESKIPFAWHLIYLLLAGIIGYLYYKKIVVRIAPDAVNSIDAVLTFQTNKPYQFRLLVPFLFALLKPIGFVSQQVIFGIYNSAVLYLLLLVYHKLLSLYFINKKLILMASPVILYPILWNYVLLNETFQYYDFTAVLLCTIGLYLIIKEKFGLFLIVIFIGLLNKESAAYLIFSYLLFNYKIVFTKKIIFNTAIIAVMIITFKVVLGYIFKNNPGYPYETGYSGNLEIISNLFSNRIYLRSIVLNFGALYVFVILLFASGAWKRFPNRKLVMVNLTIVPYYIFGIYLTYICEVRVYAELIPMITTLFIIYLSNFKVINLQPVSCFAGTPAAVEAVAIKKNTAYGNLEKQVSFDKYIETYKKEIQGSINFIGQDVDFFIELKANLLIDIARKYLGSPGEIKTLDIGSGVGLVDRFLLKEMKNLYGVDVEEGVVEKAKKNNPSVTYNKYDGKTLPFENGSFDMAFAINVMHHVPPADWENFTGEMFRILKPGGIAAVFEHNPLNPLTRLAVSRCEFDRDAVLLNHGSIKKLFRCAGFETLDDAYIVFFPFKSKIFRIAEKFIKWLPLGAQHYAVGRKLQNGKPL